MELTLLRLATGLGMGVSIANALALTTEFAVPRLRSRIITFVYSMSALGGVLGASVASSILASFSWQGLYFLGGIIPLILVVILLVSLPESRSFLALRNRASGGEAGGTAISD